MLDPTPDAIPPKTPTPALGVELHPFRVGDGIVVTREVLAEVGREVAGLPPTWIGVPAGTRGIVIGWRERAHGLRAILEVYGGDQRLVVFIGVAALERAQSLVQIARPSVMRRSRRH